MTQSPGRPRGTSTRPARQHSASNRVARVWVMAQEKVAPYHAVMTDKTMAKLRTLLKGYAERVAKPPAPRARMVTSSHDRIGTMTVDAVSAEWVETKTLSFIEAVLKAN